MDSLNETDVREDFAMPLLLALGYAKNTAADIRREFPLIYERVSLGRKKPTDPILRGRADYVLAVAGAGRWVLEVKAPHIEISQDDIEQALTYARHPEVGAAYAALYNSKRFLLFELTQQATERPRIDLFTNSPQELAEKLAATLSPAAIRRDCSPRKVDLGRPLADGARSEVTVVGGHSQYTDYSWSTNVTLPTQAIAPLEQLCAVMRGFRSSVVAGRVWRGENGRIIARIEWSLPHEGLLSFAQRKNLLEAEYTALSTDVSTDADAPTVFEIARDTAFQKGEAMFDLMRWKQQVAGHDGNVAMRGQAVGFLLDGRFRGTFHTALQVTMAAAPGLEVNFGGEGDFEIIFDTR